MEGSQATHYTPHVARERPSLTWTHIGGLTIARLSSGMPGSAEWRAFIDHLRPSVRPMILWTRGRVWLGAHARTELAAAIGSSTVAFVADDDLGRGLATALRWLGVDAHTYSSSEFDQLETDLDLPTGICDRLLEQVR